MEKNKIYGYARVSTRKQVLERQLRNIREAYPDAVIYADMYTGTRLDRPNWQKLFKRVSAGDTIVFDQVSRMSRDAEEGFAVYEELYGRGVILIFLKEPHINTETYRNALDKGVPMTGTNVDYILEGVNKYLMCLAKEQIRLAFQQAEKEVEDLRRRTKEGIAVARSRGAQIGLNEGTKLITKKSVKAKEVIKKYSKTFDGIYDDAYVMHKAGISRNSYYKYKRELKNGI